MADRRIIDLQELNALSAATFVAVDSESHGTRKYDIGSLVNALTGAYPVWDETNARYTNESISAMLDARRDGQSYGVSIPKGSATTCTKIASNAGIANPVPGTIGTASVDPYVGRGPFRYYEVNGYVDADGTPHVTGIMGDGRFRRDGSNGDVWIMTPVLWWRQNASGEETVERYISDTRLSGMSAQPHAYLPDGSLRPYMLYAKYAGVKGADGYMHSYSGYQTWNRTVSHNSLITSCRTATTGYSGKSVADDWYVKTMFLMKYATKDSQSVFAGCTNYNYQYSPAVAETGVTRVILTNAQAANLLVGSAMMLGTHTGNNDRNTASNYNKFDGVKILRIDEYDADNKAVYMDTTTTFDTLTTDLFSTSPWWTGTCDMLDGDGSPTSNSSGKEPFVMQGIEMMIGCYEILGDVIISNDGTNGWIPYVNHDSRNEATSVTENYVSTGRALPTTDADGAKYPLYTLVSEGLDYGSDTGGSTSTGMCDQHYTQKLATTGTREWCGLGYLYVAANAGLWSVYGSYGLASSNWSFGSRLSGTGRAAA